LCGSLKLFKKCGANNRQTLHITFLFLLSTDRLLFDQFIVLSILMYAFSPQRVYL
jgi:hypothetical protein